MRDWEQLTAIHHTANPDIYTYLVDLARRARAEKGLKKVGMELLVNLLRWEHNVGLNQNFAAHYARMIMRKEPDLDGFFNLKRRNALVLAEERGQ